MSGYSEDDVLKVALAEAMDVYLRTQTDQPFPNYQTLWKGMEAVFLRFGFDAKMLSLTTYDRGMQLLEALVDGESDNLREALQVPFALTVEETRITGELQRIYKGGHVRQFLTTTDQLLPSVSTLTALLHLYAAGYQQVYGSPPASVSIEFVRAGKLQTKTLTFNKPVELTAPLVSAIAHIRANSFHPVTTPHICQACPFKKSCPTSLAKTSDISYKKSSWNRRQG